MSDNGRIAQTIGLRTRHQVYGSLTPSEVVDELDRTTLIDLAHVVMLAEQQLIRPAVAGDLLAAIVDLRSSKYSALAGSRMPRGVYLAYEQHLMERLGDDVGGVLHTGRSRNDMKATATLIDLRGWLLDLVEESTRLVAVLLARGRASADLVMPVHTHFQAAMPITYGYYLIGVATALMREIESLRDAEKGLRRCPMGAAAIAGTDLPLDPGRIALLLGFESPPLHAVDAIGSRDVVLRVLGCVAGLTVVLSRLGTDLQLWSTEEFGFVTFPDRLVGGSSAMPQKRNAFLLEHVKAGAGAVAGAWTGVLASVKSTPFTNSIEVGTEAVALAWPGLAAAKKTLLLSQVLVSGARPRRDRMRQRADDSFTNATAVANQLVMRGVPFRIAHHAVGRAVREALEHGERRLSATSDALKGFGLSEALPDPATAVDRAVVGGGPAAWHVAFEDVRCRLEKVRSWKQHESARLRHAHQGLDAAVHSMIAATAERELRVSDS